MAVNYDKYLYSTGTYYISNCGSDESGGYSGGKAGDQTGNEWVLKAWYDRPWNCVLRYPDQNVALLIAQLAIEAALNDHIGYDQGQRETFWEKLKKANYRPANITEDCEADCSSGVIAIVKAVGYLLGIKALQNISATYTGDMRAAFKSAGFEVLTDSKYTTQTKYLLPGDINLNDSHHTATNVTVGSKATFNPTSDTEMTAELDPAQLWSFLMGEIGNSYGVAGLMGNLKAESALIPINLQDSYEKSLGYTDTTYTQAVDNGSYSNFQKDAAGYGLAQWTYSSRKKALLSYATSKGTSIGNGAMQEEFLVKELKEDFASVWSGLKSATSVKEASDLVLTKFEQPADQSDSVKTKRAGYGIDYYDKYAGTVSVKSLDKIVQEVIAGKWGNDPERSQALTAAGYDSEAVRAKVNEYYGVGGSSDKDENGNAYAEKHESGYSNGKKYKVNTASGLNMRTGPSSEKLSNGKDKYSVITALPNGTSMTYYGYYTNTNGVKWMLVISGGTTGWVCSTYVKAA